jgi:hypothetical protein
MLQKSATVKNAERLARQLKRYERRWVGLTNGKVAVSGASMLEVKQKAEQARIRDYTFYLVPSSSTLPALQTAV